MAYASFLFDFDEPILNLTKFNGITAWTNGTFGRRDDGAFTYDSGTGRKSNSIDSGEQYALFRVVLPEVTHYFLGIEDILLSETLNDRDYNDYVVRFDRRPPGPRTDDAPAPRLGIGGACSAQETCGPQGARSGDGLGATD